MDIAVLASGSGTNLQALIDSADLRPHINVVISDNASARALDRARKCDIDVRVVRWEDHPDRESFSAAVADVIESAGAKGVVLAGFMRILSPAFIERFPDRILNIHPSLLPAFPGARAVEAALDRRVKVTGVTVHFVDEQVDHGPIIEQAAVLVEPTDTIATLHERIQRVEHELYPSVVRDFVSGNLVVENGRVIRQ